MRHDVIDDVASLVKPGSVHRRLYDDPAIFELELERVFGSAWIYVGHESQDKQPGDYFCTLLCTAPPDGGPDGGDSGCGENASCQCSGGVCGCTPTSCL